MGGVGAGSARREKEIREWDDRSQEIASGYNGIIGLCLSALP